MEGRTLAGLTPLAGASFAEILQTIVCCLFGRVPGRLGHCCRFREGAKRIRTGVSFC